MGVAPWELATRPQYWRDNAEAAMYAENKAGLLSNALQALRQMLIGI